MNKENDNRQECQFEVWTECNSRCVFCYLSTNNIKTLDDIKIKQMNEIIDSMKADDFCEKFNKVAFIGGEFYQGQLSNPEVKSKFMEMMDVAADLLNSGKIIEVWTCATLTIGDQKDMYEVLKKFNDISKVWVLTSYDTIGRFHTKKMLDTWDYHMKNIHKQYPFIKFNVCTILTQDLLTKYLNDKFSFHDFQKEYHASFFFKQPSPGSTQPTNTECSLLDQYYEAKQIMETKLPGFFPKRNTFLEFLIKFKQDCPELYDKLFNLVYRADDLYRNFNDEESGHRMQQNHRNKITLEESIVGNEKDCGQNTNKCGHLINYSGYIDSKECMICDRNLIQR